MLPVAVAFTAAAIPVASRAETGSTDVLHGEQTTVIVSDASPEDIGVNETSVPKLTQPLVDTPQSISIVSAKELSDRGITSLEDALRTIPGITLGAGEYSWQGDNAYLRGFPTRDDMFIDGQRDYGYYSRDPFDTDSVEVLKGPSSILFGRGSAGGDINQVSKLASSTAAFAADAIVDSADMRRATIDWDSPVALGEGAALRVSAMAQHAQVADRDTTQSDRWGVAPSLALGLGSPTRLWVNYFHQTAHDVPDYGIPWLDGRPAPVNRSNFYGFSSDFLDTSVNVATARLEHDFGGSAMLRSQLRYSADARDFRLTEAAIPAGTEPTVSPTAIAVTRNEFQGFSTDRFLQDQTDLVLRFHTAAFSHAIVSGFEVGRESPRPTYITNVGVPGTNLADPRPQAYSVALSYERLHADTVATTAGLYVLDTVQVGPCWQLMGGVRWDSFDARYRSTGYTPAGTVSAITNVDHVDRPFSYRAALIYAQDARWSLYATLGTSFDPSAEGIESLISSGRSLAQANLNLDAEKNRAYELGTKWNLIGDSLFLGGSIFRLDKLNARVPDPTNPGFNILGGDERVTGAEIEMTGHITSSWLIRASYTYLASEVTRTTPGGPLLGAPLTNAPRNSSTLWTEYFVSRRLELGVGAVQVSSRLGQDTAASYEVASGYVVMNGMANYAFAPHGSVQLNLKNLTNRNYMDELHPFHVIPGAGLTAQLSLAARY